MDLIAAFASIAKGTSATIGVTDTRPFPEEKNRIDQRVDEGLHGGLSFTYANPHLAANPDASFPWAESIVVAAVPYLREGDGERDDRPVARFADGDRYDQLRVVLDEIQAELVKREHRTEVVFDDNRLLDRPLAIRAGVVWSGKSTMALTPGAGPWVLLGSVVTDAVIPNSDPMRRSCGTCDACIPACPTGAIIAPGVLDARRCISAILQRRGSIAPEFRTAIGARIYGCDDCLVACPPGQPALRRLAPTVGVPSAVSFLVADDAELERVVDRWYVPSRRMRFVRRNALVALGNTGDTSALDLLVRYLEDDDEMLAGHAAWAIGRIGGSCATALLRSALAQDPVSSVRDELQAAVVASEHGGVYADTLGTRQPHNPELIDSEEPAQ